jgi:hypothetical protein
LKRSGTRAVTDQLAANQGRVIQEVWSNVIQKYGPQVNKSTKDAATKEISAAK